MLQIFLMSQCLQLPRRKLTRQVKRDHFKRKIVFQPAFFWGYVGFRGSKISYASKVPGSNRTIWVWKFKVQDFWFPHFVRSSRFGIQIFRSHHWAILQGKDRSNQPMVNGWFGLVLWIPGIPLLKGLLLGCTPRIPNHQPKPTSNY